MDDKKEPARPAPSSGRTTGVDWSRLSDSDPDEFARLEREMRSEIRSRANGDFSI
jgi:hypothetical protein